MKAKFTFLAALFLLTTSSYALEQVHNKRSKLAGSFLKSRHEFAEKNTERNPFHRKMEFQKQARSLKSAQEVKQRLDSFAEIYWDDSTSQWVTDYKVEFKYDANWNMIQDLDYEWDETTGQLVNIYKSDYSYDAKGNMTQGIYYGGWDDENEEIHLPVTVSRYKETYTYDANGNMTQGIEYRWDKISNQFVTDWKYDYTYDASGNLIQEIASWFDTNQVETKTKMEYKYDTKGKLTLSTSFDFSSNTNEWIKGNIEEYTYDSKGNNTLVLKTDLQGISNDVGYYGYEKDEYTYNANGQVTQYLNSRMENGAWIVYDKNTTMYDDKGNTTQEIGYYNWDEQTNQWMDIWKSEYTFDYKYTTNDLVVPWWWEEEFETEGNLMTEINDYDWNIVTNQWESDGKLILSYSPVNVTSVNPLNTEILSIFPNPCFESVSFNLPDSYTQISFELFDLQGRMVIQKQIINNEKVSMEGLGSGMYIYKLNIDGKKQSGKLVKE